MPDSETTKSRSGHPGRLLWIIGMAVGIIAGGAVAVRVANSAARPTIGRD
jgi:hypothetical protein